VYSLLTVQLLITTLICYIAMTNKAFADFLANPAVLFSILAAYIAISVILCCCREWVRKYGLPILLIFTLVFSLLVGMICANT
jgi:FtsH-binding integral membrane protein